MWQEVEKQLNVKLPFVVYRKPKEEEVNVICQNDNALNRVVDFSRNGFVFAAFDTKKDPIILRADKRLRFQFSVTEASLDLRNSGPSSEMGHDDYIDLLEKAINDIDSGEFHKVVLSRVMEVENKTSPIKLLQRILSTYKNAFCYLWYHPKVGLWLGATPEILLQSQSTIFTTMSLAGTMKYVGVSKPAWGNKELNEQVLVTDYILNALEGKVTGLEKSDTETVRAGELLHLRTKITGYLKEDGLHDVVKALHPTPAICGFPKKKALNFILNNESYEREFYGGYLGELNLDTEKSATLYVNLRCMQQVEGKMKIYVGGGVTKDSDPEKEWQETVNKSGTMLRVLSEKK